MGYRPWGRKELDTTEQLTLHYTVVERASQVALVVKNLPANAGDVKEWVPSLGREDPWRKKWQPTPVFLPEKNPMCLVDHSSWGLKRIRHN